MTISVVVVVVVSVITISVITISVAYRNVFPRHTGLDPVSPPARASSVSVANPAYYFALSSNYIFLTLFLKILYFRSKLCLRSVFSVKIF
jgi:hypothetical protein